MGSLKFVPVFVVLLAGAAFAQSYGIGHTPSTAELAQDITISPTGANLPVGHGTAAEGKALFVDKGCEGCHGEGAAGGVTAAPGLVAKKGPTEGDAWARGGLAVRSPVATILWDIIHRGMPLGNEGTLAPNEVYALTAYLLAANKIIPENQVLDQNKLAKVKMPIGDDWKRAPDWKPNAPRIPASLLKMPN